MENNNNNREQEDPDGPEDPSLTPPKNKKTKRYSCNYHKEWESSYPWLTRSTRISESKVRNKFNNTESINF
jgi:hypothetical protein